MDIYVSNFGPQIFCFALSAYVVLWGLDWLEFLTETHI